MPEDRKKAFTKANYGALLEIANKLDLGDIHIDRQIKDAQGYFEKGIYQPENGLEPKESFLLSKIMNVVTPENCPPLLIVYLNDRNGNNLSESNFPTLLARETWAAMKELCECAEELANKYGSKNHVERS